MNHPSSIKVNMYVKFDSDDYVDISNFSNVNHDTYHVFSVFTTYVHIFWTMNFSYPKNIYPAI